MIFYISSFTKTGNFLEKKIKSLFPEIKWISRTKNQSINDFAKAAFEKRIPLVFIGACGIAVRAVSPFVKDKFLDPPVIVLDERGKFVIPLLSGHIGGANEISCQIAEKLCAVPVISTATDSENLFAVDVFAKKNSLRILNREGIVLVSKKILEGKRISLWIEKSIQVQNENSLKNISVLQSASEPDFADIKISTGEIKKSCTLKLKPKILCLGIGCKKGKSFEEIKNFVEKNLKEKILDIACVCSIDIKKDEEGIILFSQFLNVPFFTFSAEELKTVKGNFSESEFVLQKTGVSNVCERAALYASGGGELLIKKTAFCGMTLALAEKIPIISEWKS